MKSVADAVLALADPCHGGFSEVVYESTTFPNRSSRMRTSQASYSRRTSRRPLRRPSKKTGMTSVTVLKDISYGSNAFDSCASLVSVTVEEGVTEIGNYMFQNTKLTSVTLPNSVTKIGASAFNGCSLTTINFGQGVKNDREFRIPKLRRADRDHPPGCHGNTRAECLRRLSKTG